ncbi:carboxymuconolactone decarboxylase family protein [Shewanella maritima]|uniref:Carboxymuconolactone decarboxylase family protein n=1 Tax=Shewanella maritima TaxID=2520507 RepID=A0A411PGD8_9GAMM|nr:carboxymuconolactone decarboxylase family protein [Shewanella maritima]QBF82623.1 carboxymuconolactone decarboxylase family protein [Shewanella maritima]
MDKSRYQKGLKLLEKIDGKAGENVISSLQDICPDLAKFIIEFPFGDIYTRDTLDLRSREVATVAALTALGNCLPQLKVHLNAALNVGCSENEIKEIILQMSVYAGFPAALNGMLAFKEVLIERGHEKCF